MVVNSRRKYFERIISFLLIASFIFSVVRSPVSNAAVPSTVVRNYAPVAEWRLGSVDGPVGGYSSASVKVTYEYRSETWYNRMTNSGSIEFLHGLPASAYSSASAYLYYTAPKLVPVDLRTNNGAVSCWIGSSSISGYGQPIDEGTPIIVVYQLSGNYGTVLFYDSDSRLVDSKYASLTSGTFLWQNPDAPQAPDGKTFIGWSTSPSAYIDAGTSAPQSAFTDKVLKLYAFYDSPVTVSFAPGGASGQKPDDISYSKYGSYQFPAPDSLINNGYTFMGWGEAVDAFTNGGTVYQPGDVLTLADPNSNKTYYAQWAKNYTVDYDLNGSTAAPPQTSTAIAGPDGTVDITAAPSNGITRPGYKFEGWSTSQNSSTADVAPGSTLTISGDTTLYAVWSQVDYKVSFDLNGAVNNPAPVIGDETGHHGDTLTLPNPALLKDYYIFNGWCANQNGTGTVYSGGGSLTISDSTPQNLMLYANWKDADKYTLSFDKGGDDVTGTLPTGGTYYNDGINDTVTIAPASLTKAGYSFAGWTKTNGSNSVDYADGATFKVTANTTLYPVWNENTFTLSYDFNGNGDALSGSVPAFVQGGPSNTNITAAAQGNMCRQHYRFKGWNTQPDGSGVSYAENVPVLLNHDITLYAQWESLSPVSLTYHSNCSDPLVQAPADNTPYYDDGVNSSGQIDSLAPVRYGYNFKGWNTQADGKGTSYQPGDAVTVTEDTDLYAVWKEGTFTLSYDRNDPTATGALPDSVTGTLSSTIRAGSGQNLKLPHHHFKEWNTEQGGSGTAYQPGDKVPLGKDTTLYAVWEKNNYEVTYDLNADNAIGTAPAPDSGTYDETFTAPDLTGISRPKYRPIGWNDDPDGNGKDYVSGTQYSFEEDKTLYVKWEAVPPYEVHYYGNGADVTGTPPEDNNTYCEDGVTETSVTVLDKNDLKRRGYEFAGWNTKPDGTGLTYQPGDDFIIKTHMNFYAQWEVGTYTLSFDKGHSAVTGNGPAAVKSRSDKDITLPNEGSFKRKDFGFTGWNTKANGSGTFYKAGSKLKILEDTTLYAQWKRLVSVSFDNSEGALKGDTSLQVTEGTKLGDVKLPSVNSGYTVKEWIINGEKVTDYKNYVVDEDSDVVLVLEKKKDPSPSPKPDDGKKPDNNKPDSSKPDSNKPDTSKPDGNGGSGNGNSSPGGNGGTSGSTSGGNGSSGNSSGGNSSSNGGTPISGTSSANGLPKARNYKASSVIPIDGKANKSESSENSQDFTAGSSALTSISDEPVPLSDGSQLAGKGINGTSAYGPVSECFIHLLLIAGAAISTLYALLRYRRIRRKKTLSSSFFWDEMLPLLAFPFSAAAWLHRSCVLDVPAALVWLVVTLVSLYILRKAYQSNLKEAEVQLNNMDYEI